MSIMREALQVMGARKMVNLVLQSAQNADMPPVKRNLERVRIDLPKGFDGHAPLTSNKRKDYCWRDGESPVLRNRILAAREITDVLLCDFSKTSIPILFR